MITERQQAILKHIVENYNTTAQPISSGGLCELFGVSSATIRNEMAHLTEAGYLVQPHTSSGRIPSERGWRYYVDMVVLPELDADEQAAMVQQFRQAIAELEGRAAAKVVAKEIVATTDAAVMIAFAPRDLYYTGLTNLFSQPEFQQMQTVVHISQVIDHLDEVMVRVFDEVNQTHIAIGTENPFSPSCSVIMSPFKTDGQKGILGLLGPMRMHYASNVQVVRSAAHLLAQI